MAVSLARLRRGRVLASLWLAEKACHVDIIKKAGESKKSLSPGLSSNKEGIKHR